jgi:hypothetical protein
MSLNRANRCIIISNCGRRRSSSSRRRRPAPPAAPAAGPPPGAAAAARTAAAAAAAAAAVIHSDVRRQPGRGPGARLPGRQKFIIESWPSGRGPGRLAGVSKSPGRPRPGRRRPPAGGGRHGPVQVTVPAASHGDRPRRKAATRMPPCCQLEWPSDHHPSHGRGPGGGGPGAAAARPPAGRHSGTAAGGPRSDNDAYPAAARARAGLPTNYRVIMPLIT